LLQPRQILRRQPGFEELKPQDLFSRLELLVAPLLSADSTAVVRYVSSGGQKTKTPEELLFRRSCSMHMFVPLGITMALRNNQAIRQTAERISSSLIFQVGDTGLEPVTPAV
jgi:hypothetical protein